MGSFNFVSLLNLSSRISLVVIFMLSWSTVLVLSEKEPVDVESVQPVDLPNENVEASPATTSKVTSNLGFIHAFVASLSVIIVSELGDKTFFIAAILAMRHPRVTVFVGAIGALALMTVLSAMFGWAVTIVPRVYTHYISIGLFILFGLKMLKEGYKMSPNEGQEEFDEVQSDLRKQEDEYEREQSVSLVCDAETGGTKRGTRSTSVVSLVSRILLQSFTLTFLAEWGDRSQLTTIILAAREDVVGVTIGGILGHALCTGLAVLGGRYVAQKISVRTVTLIGGVVFLMFAVTALFLDPTSDIE
ncbi:hypothetical protein B566_EDAN014515 [Ephemera danica]|nr:hypothetical protein B566_EDAN014515 [Ephemera danica]